MKAWVLSVSVFAWVLGVLMASSVGTFKRAVSEQGLPLSFGAQRQYMEQQKRALMDQQQTIAKLRENIAELEKKVVSDTGASGLMKAELDKLRFESALVPVKGPGIKVTLRDSQKPLLSDEEGVIHESDLLMVVNELRIAGAEAIAINDQRVGLMTGIRCVGSVVMVNNVPMAAPYVVSCIGDGQQLESALRMRGGVVDQFKADPSMIVIEQVEQLILSGHAGQTQYRWAKPASQKTGLPE